MAEGDSELQELYRDVLLDYFRSEAHKGRIEDADLRAHGVNPVCGDEIELSFALKGELIASIRFSGHGCVISQASAALMAEAVEGRALPEARRLAAGFKEMMVAGSPASSLPPELATAGVLESVRRFPVRVKCATLGWNTLLQGLASAAAPKEGS
jgi:nitrogen fixation NifU-like protein